MPTLEQVGAIAVDRQPLHVLDPISLDIRYQNPASLELFGRLANAADLEALRDPLPDGVRQPLHGVLRLLTRRGARAYLLDSRQQDGLLVQVFKDISDLDLQLDDLCRGSQIDPVSQALDRRSLVYALVREMTRAERNGEPLHLLLLHMAGLQRVDRIQGQGAVDRIIAGVAEVLQSTLRQTDLLGRCEEQRLALILPGTDAAGAAWVAERSRRLIASARFRCAEAMLDVGLVTGITEFGSGDTPEDMADRARRQIPPEA